MATTYTLISSNTLSSSAASVTFSSIPNTYTDLVIQASTRTDRSNQTYDNFRIRFNSDSGTNYSDTVIEGYSTGVRATSSGASQTALGGANLTTNSSISTANTFGSFELYIPNYNSTSSKAISEISIFEQNTTSAYQAIIDAGAGLYRGTSAITSITLYPATGPNWLTNSSFYLYGIKNS